jgi:hypothetical protein
MPKSRPKRVQPNLKKGERRRKRVKRPRSYAWLVDCLNCKKHYGMESAAAIKVCIFCKSDEIVKRPETLEERQRRVAEDRARSFNMFGRLLNGLFGIPLFGGHPSINGTGPKSELEAELLKEGYRKLAQKYHPDKGGDSEKMKELNRLKEKFGL